MKGTCGTPEAGKGDRGRDGDDAGDGDPHAELRDHPGRGQRGAVGPSGSPAR